MSSYIILYKFQFSCHNRIFLYNCKIFWTLALGNASFGTMDCPHFLAFDLTCDLRLLGVMCQLSQSADLARFRRCFKLFFIFKSLKTLIRPVNERKWPYFHEKVRNSDGCCEDTGPDGIMYPCISYYNISNSICEGTMEFYDYTAL